MKRNFFMTFMPCGLLVLLAVQAWALGGRIHYGIAKIVPGISVEEGYDDNIFLQNGDNNSTELKESDLVTHIRPLFFLDCDFPGQRGHVKAGYQGNFAYYKENNNNDWQVHQGIFDLNYMAPGGLIFSLYNLFVDAEDPYTTVNNFRLGLQTKRWTNDLDLKIGWNFSDRFKVFGYSKYYKQNYDAERDYTQDFIDHEFGGGFQARLLPKTWGFFRYHYGERDFFTHPWGSGTTENNDADLTWHRVNIGLTWDADAKLSGDLNFGYKWRAYDNRVDADGLRYEDKDSWIASTAVSWQATTSTVLGLSVIKEQRQSLGRSREYFEDTDIGVKLEQGFYRKMSLSAGIVYSKNDYTHSIPANREDDNYKFDLSLDYRFRDWLTAAISYLYWEKDSNIRVNDFIDNRVWVSLRLIY